MAELTPAGRRFPGGSRTVEHWENWLLTDCTRRSPMADGLLHPIALFHVPIQAAGTSISELFALVGAQPEPGAVTLLGYDWEYLVPLREGVEYHGSGGVADVTAVTGADGAAAYEDAAFTIELHDPDGVPSARVTNRWRVRRGTSAPHGARVGNVLAGTPISPLVVDDVGVDRMKTMAALLHDPYPIHWDPEAAAAAGYGRRPVNQGPLNVGYVANMLMAWAGDGAIRRLTVAFHGRVLAGDTVVAGGTVLGEMDVGGERRVNCTIWLDRDGERVLSGTAELQVS